MAIEDFPEHLLNQLRILPEKPGVYQFFDATQKIIYIGKAKNLKKRVSSYFNKDSGVSGKTMVMVKKIDDIQTIVVDTEYDALLLENNLIKQYQPRYNVLLKDDKSFPWICIKNERFPRVFPTRHFIKDGSQYFGPYAAGRIMHTMLDFIRQLYPLRTCNLKLEQNLIKAGKYKICLEYHIGNCKAPCENKQGEEEYNGYINDIRHILKGNISMVKNHLKQIMQQFSADMEFEKAQMIKEKIKLIEKFQSKSMVANPDIHNVDVFSIITDDDAGYVNYLKVVDGAVIQAHTVELKKRLDETPEELLGIAIAEFRQRFDTEAKEIIVPLIPEIEIPAVNFNIPQKGDKKKLLELSERNVKYYIQEKLKQLELVDPEQHTNRLLNQAMKDLHLHKMPVHIECFDNSNIQGAFPVAAMVVFKNGKPAKNEYRHFNIKTVEGPNDFASMEEVIFRRYKRLLDENQSLPQLIIVDGGKGQLSSALKSLEKLELRGKIGIIGIAKKLEEIYYPGDSLPLYLDKKSETLRLIQYMRDEAHRFGITHHRKKREKNTIKTELTEIKGIGEQIATKLLQHFGSVEKIKNATMEELIEVAGNAKAKIINEFYKTNKS